MTLDLPTNEDINCLLARANLDSLLKKRATLFELDYDLDSLFKIKSKMQVRATRHLLCIRREPFETADQLLAKLRIEENLYIEALMGCKERWVRSTLWQREFTGAAHSNFSFVCYVSSIGLDSISNPRCVSELVQ